MRQDDYFLIKTQLSDEMKRCIKRDIKELQRVPTFSPATIEGMYLAERLVNDCQWEYDDFIAIANNINALKFTKGKCLEVINDAIIAQSQQANAYRSTIEQDKAEAIIEGMKSVYRHVSNFFHEKVFMYIHYE